MFLAWYKRMTVKEKLIFENYYRRLAFSEGNSN